MSRIGQLPVPIPTGVTVNVGDGNAVEVKGPKGSLVRALPASMTITAADGMVQVTRPNDERKQRALHGLTRQLLANMVTGVTEGFQKRLEIQGTGYRASLQGRALDLQLGFSHPQVIRPPEGVDIQVPDPTRIVVEGIDKEAVGQIAAEIRAVRPADPYKGKGIRYAGDTSDRSPARPLPDWRRPDGRPLTARRPAPTSSSPAGAGSRHGGASTPGRVSKPEAHLRASDRRRPRCHPGGGLDA